MLSTQPKHPEITETPIGHPLTTLMPDLRATMALCAVLFGVLVLL